MSLTHSFTQVAPRNWQCHYCGVAADDYNSGQNLDYMRTQECPKRVRDSLAHSRQDQALLDDVERLFQAGVDPLDIAQEPRPIPSDGRVTEAEIGAAISQILHQVEERGVRVDPGHQHPLAYAAYLLLDYLHRKPDGGV